MLLLWIFLLSAPNGEFSVRMFKPFTNASSLTALTVVSMIVSSFFCNYANYTMIYRLTFDVLNVANMN